MENDFVRYMILLEEALADFYKNIKGEEKYDRISPLLEFMEAHSSEHADLIKEMHVRISRPVLDPNLVSNYQNHITKNVAKMVAEERDLIKALTTLADAEEGIGKLYDKLTSYVKDLSAYYADISRAIEKIARDEYHHRDLLLNDRKRLSGGKEEKG